MREPQRLRRTGPTIRVYGLATVCVLAAMAAGVAASFAVGFAIGLHNGASPGRPRWVGGTQLYGLASILAVDAMFIAAAWGCARALTGHPRRALGLGGLRNPGLLTLLAVLDVGAIFVLIPLLIHVLAPSIDRNVVVDSVRTGMSPAVQAVSIAVLIVLAPVAEELFFRGWLWTALSRHWPVPAVMVGTAAPWLLIHITSGLWRPVLLIPAAILFSLARHRCGGTGASILLHAMNNGIAVVLLRQAG